MGMEHLSTIELDKFSKPYTLGRVAEDLRYILGDCAMSGFTCLWVDDTRPIPSDCGSEWCSARSAWEALLKLELIQFEVVSLDHDLASFIGNKELTGYDILMWLVARKLDGLYVPQRVTVHSANPVGVSKMKDTIAKYWG